MLTGPEGRPRGPLASTSRGRGDAGRGRAQRRGGRRLALAPLLALGLFLLAPAGASAQTIVNQASTGGQANWLQSYATSGESADAGNRVWISLLVKHPANSEVTGLKIDDDWDGADETAGASIRNVTSQQPNVAGGYTYSRVNYSYQIPTSNTGMGCPLFGTRTRRTDNRQIRVRARLSNGTETPTSSSPIKFVATGQCEGTEDYPYLYGQSQSASSINTGQTVTFTYNGDDKDVSGQDDFDGIRWRLRKVNTGATTAPQISCPNNGDHAEKTLSVTFPDRGRWVVEAELLNNDCTAADDNMNPGYWFYIGAVDVNSPASASPTLDLSATRPSLNGNATITASAADGADAADGGRVEAIEWDLNENTADGVNGYETATIAEDTNAGLTSAQLQRTINTAGMAPGLHTVRARIGDNGALGGADNIRRTDTDTVSFLVDSPPVANDQSYATETETAVAIALDVRDADADPLTLTITDAPDNGTLSGSGTARTYTPDPGFAGNDSFTYRAQDGFGGQDTATVRVRVDPDTTIDSAPSGTLDSRGARFEFSSRASGAGFECSLDGSAFGPCSSPHGLSDLSDGPHELRVRATAAGNTDQSPASRSWTVDAYPSLEITSGPSGETSEVSASFEFEAAEAGATIAPTTDCKLDDGDFRPCESPVTYTDVDDGPHTFAVRATDAYGKRATRERSWSVDAIGSNTVIDTAPPAQTKATDAQLEFSSPDDTVDHFECRLDSEQAWSPCASPRELTSLAEGVHVFRVRAVDAAQIADPTPASARWRVDLTAPNSAIDSGPPDPGNDATPSFDLSADEPGSTFECRVDSADAGAWAPCPTPFTTAPLGEGAHELEVRATDAVGNVEQEPSSRRFTVDLTAPESEITSGPADGSRTAAASATFSFGSADSGASFQCRLDGGPWSGCDSGHSYAGLADGEHEFSVRARDAAGNVEPTPASRSWSVDATPPQTSLASGPSGVVREPDASFRLLADEQGASFECSLDGAPFAPCASPSEHTGLADGDHEFRARAIDALGNVDPTPARRQWTVDTRELPGPKQQPAPPEREECTFLAELSYCADPFITARAEAFPGRTGRGAGELVLRANGGGSDLARVSFELPRKLKVVFLRAGRAGRLKLFGYREERKVALRSPDEQAALATGEPSVSLAGGELLVEDLPPRVRRMKLLVRGAAVLIRSRDCGTSRWHATLVDRAANAERVSTAADVRCRGGG